MIKKTKIVKFSDYVSLLVVFLIFGLVGLLQPGYPLTHDGRDHAARIANFYQSLSEGNFVPRWAGNLNWGYGHPILMFLYPFSSYTVSGFHALGFSLTDSITLFFAVMFLGSGLSMYYFLRREVSDLGALTGALLYTFAPYRFVDMYVRGAIGEHAAFFWFPMILLGVRLITDDREKSFRLGFGMTTIAVSGLILSHNALSLMFFPVVFLYAFWRLLILKNLSSSVSGLKSSVFCLLSSLLIGFGLAAFFWVPALIEGKYTLREIVTGGVFASRYVAWKDFFLPVWNYGQADILPKQLGLLQWGFITVSLLAIVKGRLKSRKLMLILFGLLGLSLIVQTQAAAPLWNAVTLLQKFQFPWRFLSLSVFLAAAIGGLIVSEFFSGKPGLVRPYLFFLFFLIPMTTFRMWFPAGYTYHPDSFYTGAFPATTDTGESSPIWSVRFMEQYPTAPAEVISGLAQITVLERTSTRHRYRIETAGARILENTLYFPNWQVYVNGQPVTVEFQDPSYRGLLTFTLPAGAHEVLVQFEETKVRRYASYISLFSLGVFTLSLFYLWKKSLN